MKPNTLIRTYVCTLLLILLSAFVGHKVHVFTEDPMHFAATCGDLLPDSGARDQVVERCVVDEFNFYPFLEYAPFAPQFHLEKLGVLLPQSTRCKLAVSLCAASLRAPPVA